MIINVHKLLAISAAMVITTLGIHAAYQCSETITTAGFVTVHYPEQCLDDEPASLPECGPAPDSGDSGRWCKVEPASQQINLYEYDEETEQCRRVGYDTVPFGVLHTSGSCCGS
jgi:hypothetical protein